MEVQAEISFLRNQKYIGKVIDVLFEEEVEGVLVGRGYMDAPEIDGTYLWEEKEVGKDGFYKVRIYESDTYDLEGELIWKAIRIAQV